jgi:archaeosine-15-forming tRNA-guanine transglycosylase
VTLRKGDARFDGEAESVDGARARPEEIAARATMAALARAEGGALALSLEGAQVVAAFGREFVFVGVTARVGRGTSLLAGSCEVRDSLDEAAALAVLDATNRWVARGR